MSSKWIREKENKVFSHVKNKVTKALKTKYPDIYFTMDDWGNTEAKFPSVYMSFSFVEGMKTLDGGTINGGIMTIHTQTRVTKTQGNNVAVEVDEMVCDELKKFLFSVSGDSTPTVAGDTKTIETNYSRSVGFNDPF